MLLTLRTEHKEHLAILTTQSSEVLVDFCKLAIDFLLNGPNLKLCNAAAQKLQVECETIENAVYGLINLLLQSCKHKLNEADFRDSVLSLGFSQEHQLVLNKFYESKKEEFNEILSLSTSKIPYYYDLDWRCEIQVASRCLLQQVTPLITMNLCLETKSNSKIANNFKDMKHNTVLQTDVVNLVKMTQVLEQALNESRSRHIRRIQNTFK